MIEDYRRFLQHVPKESDLYEELRSLSGDEDAIRERFGNDLKFGTAGLRGIIGVGTAYMNRYTVARAAFGLRDFVEQRIATSRGVFVVGGDTRHKSDEFTLVTARVLASRGARVYLASDPVPVPLLSFAVRHLGCDAGVCITASHNPSAYNGFKVFSQSGAQLLEEDAAAVSKLSQKYDYFTPISDVLEGEILPLDETVFDAYFAALKQHVNACENCRDLSVVYTPLHGSGAAFVPRALKMLGVEKVYPVSEQMRPDGDFPTCKKPNPEEREALTLALKEAEETGSDLMFATDPDCDRVGVAARGLDGTYRLFTGNETGLLLMDALLGQKRAQGRLSPESVVCTTIVSAPMADAIAADYGVRLERVLTGFKYIGATIDRLQAQGKIENFLFGFEESYGCLSSTHVRDKDAVEACLLVCRLAAELKAQGQTLQDRLAQLEARYGIWRSALCNYAFTGADAAERLSAFMKTLRDHPLQEFASSAVEECVDYSLGVGDLPRADVLEFRLQDGGKVLVRPSGTEPKLKIYLFAKACDEAAAQQRLNRLVAFADHLVE